MNGKKLFPVILIAGGMSLGGCGAAQNPEFSESKRTVTAPESAFDQPSDPRAHGPAMAQNPEFSAPKRTVPAPESAFDQPTDPRAHGPAMAQNPEFSAPKRTVPAPESAFDQPTDPRAHGPAITELEIKKVQEALKTRGYDPGATDGTMSDQTRQALRSFQHANNLTVTGTINTETAKELGLENIVPPSAAGSSQPSSRSR